MSGSCEISLFNSTAISAIVSLIGTFVFLVPFGCSLKRRGTRIDKTAKFRQESVILHADKDIDNPTDLEPNQAVIEKNMNQELNKLIESKQNSDKNLTNRKKDFKKKNEAENDEKKVNEEKLRFQEMKTPEKSIPRNRSCELKQLKTQPTQMDDFELSKTSSSTQRISQKRESVTGKQDYNNNNNAEEIRENFGKIYSAEEPSTLEGVASISRDDAPSAISHQIRNISLRTNLISKRRGPSKIMNIENIKRRKFKNSS